MRAIDKLAIHILERALGDLRDGRISCSAFSMHDNEHFGFAVDFVAGGEEESPPNVLNDADAEPTKYRPPSSADSCVECGASEIHEAGDQMWVCLACNHNWRPFRAESKE